MGRIEGIAMDVALFFSFFTSHRDFEYEPESFFNQMDSAETYKEFKSKALDKYTQVRTKHWPHRRDRIRVQLEGMLNASSI